SIWYYAGQPTDPVSHFLFTLSLIYLVGDCWALLAVSLALGVVAKETIVLLVPAYLACYWRRGLPALVKVSLLGAACVAAFLATRLPWGWRPGQQSINGTEELMIASNLGLPGARYGPAAPLALCYLQPALFVVPFLPTIVLRRREIDPRLKAAA